VALAAVGLARAADFPHADPLPLKPTPNAKNAPPAKAAPPSTTPPPRVVVSVVAPPVVTGCWQDIRLFKSFQTGVVDHCRGHLDYVPGALDCYAFSDEVCSVYTPSSGEWSEARRPLPPNLIVCPDEVGPPVCPRLTWR
jgi:hypothetical protein